MFIKKSQNGFTIVELLIVIVVIAILAAISLVAFNGIQQRALASKLSSASAQSKKKLSLYQVEYGQFPLTGNLLTAGIANKDGVNYQYTSDGVTYCLTATDTNLSFKTSNTESPNQGVCPGHNSGGAVTITNLYKNPNLANTGFVSKGGSATSTLALSSAGAFAESSFIRSTMSSTGSFVYYLGSSASTHVAVNSGAVYTMSCYVRSSIPTTVQPSAYWWNSGTLLSNNGGSSTSVSNSWTRISHTDTAPSTATTLQVRFIFGTINSTDTVDIDACIVTEGSTLYNFADGNSPGWTWESTAHASTSSGPAL